MNKVKSLIINDDNPKSLKSYLNLKKVTFLGTYFNHPLDFLPESIEEINIDNLMFNQDIPHILFPNLKKLIIKSTSFDGIIDDKLIEQLELLHIKSPTYTQKNPKFDYVNNPHIKIESLMFGCAQPPPACFESLPELPPLAEKVPVD